MDQALGEVETAVEPLWSLMRFLSLRLKPKAAARPSRGSGPGTLATGDTGDNDEELITPSYPEKVVNVSVTGL